MGTQGATNRRPLVAVCGASSPRPEDLAAAREVGRLCAERGWTVLCGGGGGVMGAAAEGAREGGGLVIGLLPGTDPAAGHPALSVALPTGLGEGRNWLLIRAAAAVIAVGGGTGTLSELALALSIGRPAAGVGTWRLRSPEGMEDAALGLHAHPDAASAVDWLARQLEPGST
ncbi:MAG TPA: LOG family protein [Candidatus Dormibacteraeota bacterium]|nr:LOG family protein [Candidatus Dormibacteraeota bacterium]